MRGCFVSYWPIRGSHSGLTCYYPSWFCLFCLLGLWTLSLLPQLTERIWSIIIILWLNKMFPLKGSFHKSRYLYHEHPRIDKQPRVLKMKISFQYCTLSTHEPTSSQSNIFLSDNLLDFFHHHSLYRHLTDKIRVFTEVSLEFCLVQQPIKTRNLWPRPITDNQAHFRFSILHFSAHTAFSLPYWIFYQQ